MQTRAIRFVQRGQIVQVADAPITRSLLDWLREDARCTGTKEGCNEGDCGACTVLVAELASDVPDSAAATVIGEGADALSLRPVNACIRFLPTLDGKAVLTVEDLGTPDQLHPVQQALVECHGSQCGFCTPGFAMSMTAVYERHSQAGTTPTRAELADDLAGNLCRCTGYRPILDAGQRMLEFPTMCIDTAALATQLRALKTDPTLSYAAPSPAFGGRVDHYFAPRNLDELAALRMQRPQARLLAGATDVGLWVNKQMRDVGDLIGLAQVTEIQGIKPMVDGALHIGAAAPLEDAWAALAARWPTLREVGLRFAGPPVRHAGTLGGNIANGSPIGDGAPVLMALDARLVLRQGARQRELRLDQFYLDYMKNQLEPGEFLQAIIVPSPSPLTQVRAYKVSKRHDCDISALCAGFSLKLHDGVVADVRLAFGGMAAIVKRAATAEAAMLGKPWNQATLGEAKKALVNDFAPLTDLRASAAYRQRVAGALLERFWLETRADAPLAPSSLNVRACKVSP